ncbi:MAG: hypothetical protein NTW96_24645 [Planctomycetia bacterium]|nr:hypothetical protein [Planctomycetia bacterium]
MYQTPDSADITAIEYRRYKGGWKPQAVAAGGDQYDFDWCEQDGILAYHMSGFGPGAEEHMLYPFVDVPKLCGKLWYDHTRLHLVDGAGKRLSDRDARKLGYLVIREPLDGNPFEDDAAREDTTEYCAQCRSYHPSESMCRHVQLEGVCWGEYCLGCGAPEVDFGETQASLYRLLRMLPPATIETMLRDTLRGRRCICDGEAMLYAFCGERNYEKRYWPGIAWLGSLDKTCKEALALTAGWLWSFQQASWRACCVVPAHRFIRHLPIRKLEEWLAIDPLNPTRLDDRPLRVSLGFKPRCANDFLFLKDPERCHEVTLWPPEGSDQMGRLGLTLSVAEVKRAPRKAVDLYFGAVIERNGQHVSELKGYDLRLCWPRTPAGRRKGLGRRL